MNQETMETARLRKWDHDFDELTGRAVPPDRLGAILQRAAAAPGGGSAGGGAARRSRLGAAAVMLLGLAATVGVMALEGTAVRGVAPAVQRHAGAQDPVRGAPVQDPQKGQEPQGQEPQGQEPPVAVEPPPARPQEPAAPEVLAPQPAQPPNPLAEILRLREKLDEDAGENANPFAKARGGADDAAALFAALAARDGEARAAEMAAAALGGQDPEREKAQQLTAKQVLQARLARDAEAVATLNQLLMGEKAKVVRAGDLFTGRGGQAWQTKFGEDYGKAVQRLQQELLNLQRAEDAAAARKVLDEMSLALDAVRLALWRKEQEADKEPAKEPPAAQRPAQDPRR